MMKKRSDNDAVSSRNEAVNSMQCGVDSHDVVGLTRKHVESVTVVG